MSEIHKKLVRSLTFLKKSQVMRVFTVMVVLFISVATNLSAAEEKKPDELRQILVDACPPERVDALHSDLNGLVGHLTKKVKWQKALKASVYRACFLDFRTFRLRMAFTLGHYAMTQGLEASTVGAMTELLTIRGVGKRHYLKLGRLWQKASATGIKEDLLLDVMSSGLGARLNTGQLEGYILAYHLLRKEGLNHETALTRLEKDLRKFKRLRGSQQTIHSGIHEIISSDNEVKKRAALTGDALWDAVENSVKDEHRITIDPADYGWDVEKLRETVNEWKGTPYKYGGMSKQGVDCSGFVIRVTEVQFPDAKLPRSARGQSQVGKKVKRSELKAGDLVFFAASADPHKITHVGIYLGESKFAHASSTRGVTVSDLDKAYYTKRLRAARRIF